LGSDSNSTPHHSATVTRPSHRRRNVFDFLRFSPRHAMPPNVTQVCSRVRDNASVLCSNHRAIFPFCSLDGPRRPSPNSLPPPRLPSNHPYASCQIGGPFVQVVHCRLSLMFLSRGATRCTRLFLLLREISWMYFQRNATAGAPKGNGGYRRDEEFDFRPRSPTRNPNSQQLEPSIIVARITTGNHGSGRL